MVIRLLYVIIYQIMGMRITNKTIPILMYLFFLISASIVSLSLISGNDIFSNPRMRLAFLLVFLLPCDSSSGYLNLIYNNSYGSKYFDQFHDILFLSFLNLPFPRCIS